MPDKQIFFHVGLGKVASTYLQYRFFPKLVGLYYIQRTRYWSYEKIIDGTDHHKYLVSREFDVELESAVRKFSSRYPQVQVIILLRRHDSWIASQYRRFVKNGMFFSFDEFLEMEGDTGFWRKKDTEFYPMLTMIEEVTGRPPFVFFHDDLKKDPPAFFRSLAAAMQVDFDPAAISVKPKHKSYSDKQLKIIRKFRLYDYPPHGNMKNPVDWLVRRWRFLVCYAILYPSRLMPASWAPEGDLIPPESLARVRHEFEDDWQKCVSYAETNNPRRTGLVQNTSG